MASTWVCSSFAHGRVCNQLAVTKPRRGMARRKVCLTEKIVWEVVPTSLRVGAHIVLCFLGDLHEGRFPNFHDALEHTAHDTDGPQNLGRYKLPGKRPNTPTQSKSKASAGPKTTRQRRRRAHTQPCRKAAPAAQGQKTRPQRARHCIVNLVAQHQSWSWRLERKCSQTSRRVRTSSTTA